MQNNVITIINEMENRNKTLYFIEDLIAYCIERMINYHKVHIALAFSLFIGLIATLIASPTSLAPKVLGILVLMECCGGGYLCLVAYCPVLLNRYKALFLLHARNHLYEEMKGYSVFIDNYVKGMDRNVNIQNKLQRIIENAVNLFPIIFDHHAMRQRHRTQLENENNYYTFQERRTNAVLFFLLILNVRNDEGGFLRKAKRWKNEPLNNVTRADLSQDEDGIVKKVTSAELTLDQENVVHFLTWGQDRIDGPRDRGFGMKLFESIFKPVGAEQKTVIDDKNILSEASFEELIVKYFFPNRVDTNKQLDAENSFCASFLTDDENRTLAAVIYPFINVSHEELSANMR